MKNSNQAKNLPKLNQLQNIFKALTLKFHQINEYFCVADKNLDLSTLYKGQKYG